MCVRTRWRWRRKMNGHKIIESVGNCRTCSLAGAAAPSCIRYPACSCLSCAVTDVTDVTWCHRRCSRLRCVCVCRCFSLFSRASSKLLDTFNYGNWLTLRWLAARRKMHEMAARDGNVRLKLSSANRLQLTRWKLCCHGTARLLHHQFSTVTASRPTMAMKTANMAHKQV